DLLGEPLFDRRLGLVEQGYLAFAHLGEMLWHNVSDGVSLRFALKFTADPAAFGPRQNIREAWLPCLQRPIVEVRRVIEVPRCAVAADLHEEQTFRHDASFAALGKARVLDCMFEK